MVKKHLPIVLLLLVWFLIAVTNYSPNTYLSGWDNLHPEFDFALNIKRSIFAVWQEYQGVGLLGGMGHAADLLRQIILWILSSVLPVQFLRYVWTLGMLGFGMLGIFVLLEKHILSSLFPQESDLKKQIGALVGAIFYGTNLATLQLFATPFEAFVTHFGFLPWLIYFTLQVFEKPTKKTFLWFSMLSLLSTTQAYVPTVSLVFTIALGLICLTALIRQPRIQTLKRTVAIWLITLCINAFWLLPFVYFTFTKSHIPVEAKMNQMATDEVYERNRAYGTLLETLQLKGFWFDTFDLDPQKDQLSPPLGELRQLANTPLAVASGFITFSVIIVGLSIVLFDPRKSMYWLVGLFLLGITMLTTDTAPFSYLNDALRHAVPLFGQIFRFPFTKFGILTGLSYSLLFAVGVTSFLWMKSRWKVAKIGLLSLAIASLSLGLYIATSDQLFYSAMKVTIPKEYTDLFGYLRQKPTSMRIANLPQTTYWGWSYERWGYTGSGFLWYGSQQPILDRAFDAWSAQNENYYWELSRALYSKDVVALEAVFDKYDVVYILLDENIISASHNRALFIDETKELLSQIPEIKIAAVFGKLTLYKRINNETTSFISIKENLPTVSPAYTWTDNDVAFSELGDYINLSTYNPQPIPRSGISLRETTHNYFYPFRSLFTKRAVDEREFNINETDQSIAISDIKNSTQAGILKTSTLVYDSAQTNDLNGASVTRCGLFRTGTSSAKMLSEGLNRFLRFENLNQRGCLSFGIPTLSHKDGYLVAVESRHITGRPLLLSLINQTVKHTELEVYLENSKVSAKGGSASGRKTQNSKPREEWQTNYFILPLLASDGLGYTVYLSNDSIGRHETINDIKSIRFYRIPYQKLVSQRVELCDRDQPCQAGLIPHKNTQPQGTFDQLSVNPALSVDHPNPAYYKVTFQPITYNQQPTTLVLSQMFDPGWKAWLLPAASCPAKQGLASLDKWYVVSCWLGAKELNDHVLVNNWANAWVLDPKSAYQTKHEPSEFILSIDEGNSSDLPAMLRIALQAGKANAELRRRWAKNNSNEVTNNELTIIVFYLPQLLEFIGFALLPIPFIWIGHRKNYRKEI